MRGFKERISGIKDRMNELAASVRGHTEVRSVDCALRLIVETSTVEVVRLDTGGIVSTRAATVDELQVHLGAKPDGWTEGENPKPGAPLPPVDQGGYDCELEDAE
jgi:hypothetical protein